MDFFHKMGWIVANWLFKRKNDQVPSKIDYIIGFGIGLREDGSPSLLSRGVVYVIKRLANTHPEAKIIFTGGAKEKGITEAEAMRRWAISVCNIPSDRIWIETKSKNTHENACNTVRMILKDDPGSERMLRNIVIVGHVLHMSRCLASFKKVAPLQWRLYGKNAYSSLGPYALDPLCTQARLRSIWRFLVWNSIAWVYFWLKRWV